MCNMLKVKDIQKTLGCSRTKAYNIVNTRGFPKIIIGRNIYIPEDKFKNWLNNYYNKKFVLK